MPKFRYMQNSFRAGEVDPSVFARSDSELYAGGLEQCLNKIVKVQGGAIRRPGTQLVADQLNATNVTGDAKLVPFRVSDDEAYVMAFTYTGSAEASYLYDVSGDTSAALTSHGIASADDLRDIQYALNGRLCFLVTDQDIEPSVYTGSGAGISRSAWPNTNVGGNSKDIGVGKRYPFYPINAEATTFAYSGNTSTGVGTVTASVSTFAAGDVDRVIKMSTGASVTWYLIITGYTSGTSVSVQVLDDAQTSGFNHGLATSFPASIAATTTWELSQWGGDEGWPNAVTFFQQRAIFSRGEKVWCSQSGDIFEFDALGAESDTGYGTVAADDPFEFSPASAEINRINWLSAGKSLVIGTSGREYVASGTQGALSALDIQVDAETSHGSRRVQPARLDNRLLFASSSNRIREFVFNEGEQSYRADDLSRLAQHFYRKGLEQRATTALPKVLEVVKQEAESTVAWMVDDTGMLYGTTRDSFVESNAWHEHRLGGNLGGEVPFVHSVASMQSSDGLREELYIAVERSIDGSDLIYLEKIGPQFFLGDDDVKNAEDDINKHLVYCDSAVFSYNATPFTSVTGLDHLEDETVVAVADGEFKGEFTVASGAITLPEEVNDVVVGLNYTSRIKTLPHNVGSSIGTTQGAIKRFDEIYIRFTRTINALFGTDENSLDRIEFQPAGVVASDPIPLFTGDKQLLIDDNPDRRGQIIIEQDYPMPMEITGIVLRGNVYD